ncbi:MAG: hypothetical protein KDA41_15830, partial [Planctomycetales bacterium]|nr:hypothetical protein [Planctomycetales bacterium]
MKRSLLLALLAWGCFAATATAEAYRVKPLDEPAPSDDVAPAIAAQLAPAGVAVMRSETSTLCNIWLCKEWPVAAGFKPSAEVLYPFASGQLIGVLQLKRSSGDFRDQDIGRGVYTLRYAQQPVDGNHVGTSKTRDFLLLVSAEEDRAAEPLDLEKMIAASKEAAESSHPAMLALQAIAGDVDKTPAIRENA